MPNCGFGQCQAIRGWTAVALMVCGGLTGCAEGPLARYGDWNPWVKSQWDKEDAEFGPSFQTRVARLRGLKGRVQRLDPAEQQRVSQELVESLHNESNPALRREVVLALSRFPTETAAVGLREALADGDPDLRVAACSAWRVRGGHEALERLAGTVGSDTDTDVRLAATRALAGFRDPAAVRALGLALEDTNPALQHQAVESLRQVSGRDFGGNIAAWRDYARGESSGAAGPQNVAGRPSTRR